MRSNLRCKTVGISPVGPIPVILRFHVILVDVPLANAGYESLPDTCRAGLHLVGRYVPVIEITYDGDCFCIGSPNGKLNSALPITLGKVCAKFLICAVEGAFRKQIPIEFA
jgi:hypothetical protein